MENWIKPAAGEIFHMLDDFDLDPVQQLIQEDWPDASELDSIERQHGRKVDFDYELQREAGKGEAGSTQQGISKEGLGHPQSSPFSKGLGVCD